MISLRQHIFSLVAVFVALAVGIAAGSLAMWAALDHNPQEEFQGVSGVDWPALVVIGASWAVAVGGICWVPLVFVARVLFRRPKSDAA